MALDDLRSIGILGGTFNPPHLGHLALARHAREELGLDRVLLMPAYRAPNKPEEPDPDAQQRLRMCQLTVGETAGLSASALEVERGGVSYTVETLGEIHERCPGAELTLILGADTACTLPDWREPERIAQLARLAVAEREGSDRARVVGALAGLMKAPADAGEPPSGGRQAHFLAMPRVEISSSMVRRRLARGERVDDLVGAAVAGYIQEHGLYRERVQITP